MCRCVCVVHVRYMGMHVVHKWVHACSTTTSSYVSTTAKAYIKSACRHPCYCCIMRQRASSHYGRSERYKNHVQGLVCFVVQDAGANDWHVVGTCSTDLSASGDKVRGTPVEDCHCYTLQGPTILVLGKSTGESQCYVYSYFIL